jgi:hypothetical protein
VDGSKIHTGGAIDCTWFQVPGMLRLPELAALPRVRIRSLATNFWRHQHVGPECLATAEAMYQLCREVAELRGEYSGEYDNLLWYFSYQYGLIHKKYKAGGGMLKNSRFISGDRTYCSTCVE